MCVEASVHHCLLCLKTAAVRTHHPLHKLLISVMAPLKHFGLTEVTIEASCLCMQRREDTRKFLVDGMIDWAGMSSSVLPSTMSLSCSSTLHCTAICYITITVSRKIQLPKDHLSCNIYCLCGYLSRKAKVNVLLNVVR